jgi:hypothetical protein
LQRRISNIKKIRLDGEDTNTSFTIEYDNRGEPYREGLSFEIEDNGEWVRVMLERYELGKLKAAIDAALEG